MAVPLFNTSAPLAPIDAEIRAKVNAILDSKRFILGPEVEGFEREFADYIGAEHAVGVANGTDALLLALRALGRRPGRRGDRPVVHVLRVRRGDPALGATPVCCDVDPDDVLMTPRRSRRC